MDEDLGNKTREELVEIAKKYHVENAGEKSPEQLRKGIFENKQVLAKIKERNEFYKNLSSEQFKKLLEQHNIEHVEEDVQDRSNVLIIELDGALNERKCRIKFPLYLFRRIKKKLKLQMFLLQTAVFILKPCRKILTQSLRMNTEITKIQGFPTLIISGLKTIYSLYHFTNLMKT